MTPARLDRHLHRDPASPVRVDAPGPPPGNPGVAGAPDLRAPTGRSPGWRGIPFARPGYALLLAAACAAALMGSPVGAANRPGKTAAAATDLTGDWILNGTASQTLMPPPTPVRRGPGEASAPMPPEDSVLPDPPVRTDADRSRPPPRRRPPSWLIRPERLEAMRTLLGETRSLSIVQTTTYVDLRSERSSRSLEIGAESQVSLPTGELADQKVRWQGSRLVVERRVPRGVKIIETFQRLPATDQLEVTVRRSGGPDDGLGKVELRRVFDREPGDAAAPSSPAAGAGAPLGGAATGPRSVTTEAAR